MHVNPYLFFLIKDGQHIVWDYKNHKQFVLEIAYIERLKALSSGKSQPPSPIDDDLAKANLISKEPFAEGDWGWDELAKIYHIGTKNIADHLIEMEKDDWAGNYLNYSQSIATRPPEFHIKKVGNSQVLPSPDLSLLEKAKFFDVVKRRKTTRSFKGDSITLDQLSTLLYVSLGPIHEKWADLEDNGLQVLGRRKAFPSAGGIHPEEAYVVALNIEGLDPGVYHYDSVDHQLTLVNDKISEEELVRLLYGQYFAEGLAFGIFLTARFEKGWWKYPNSRGYRVTCFDLGHASQTILLTATALGLDTWITGAFGDVHVEKFLNLDTSTEQPFLFVGGGYGDQSSIDKFTLNALNNG